MPRSDRPSADSPATTTASTDDATTAASLGSLPRRVIISSGGGVAAAPDHQAEVTEADSGKAVKTTVDNLTAGLNHPDQDDVLIEGCKGLGGLVRLRVDPGTPLKDVARPPHADTHLTPVTEFIIQALREEPLDPRLIVAGPDDLERRLKLLVRARRLLRAFTPVVANLDLIVRNLEDGLDSDIRGTYWRLSGLIDNDPNFAETFAPLKDWATINGQRSAQARRANARREAQGSETAKVPAPVVTVSPAPTLPTPAPVVTVSPTPAPPLHLATAATAPASRRRGRSRRRG